MAPTRVTLTDPYGDLLSYPAIAVTFVFQPSRLRPSRTDEHREDHQRTGEHEDEERPQEQPVMPNAKIHDCFLSEPMCGHSSCRQGKAASNTIVSA